MNGPGGQGGTAPSARPAGPGRRLFRVLPWTAVTIVVLVVNVGAIRATVPPGNEVKDLFPLTVGTTWVYDTTTEGQPGRLVRQVVADGRAGEPDLPPQTVLRDRFTDALGQPSGPDRWTTVAARGSELLLLQEREGSTSVSKDPPAPLYRVPVREGESWTWSPELPFTPGGNVTEQVDRTEVVGVETLDVLGERREGCGHYQTVSRNGSDPGTREEWVCPGIGPVRMRAAPDQGPLFEAELIEVHAPGTSSTAVSPSSGPGFEAGGPAVAGYVPGADPDLGRVAWTESLRSRPDYPPLGWAGTVIMTSISGGIVALDTETGAQAWRLNLVRGIVAPPQLAGPLVIVLDVDRNAWALDARTGAARWVVRLPDVVAAPPIATDDVLVVPLQDGTVRGLAASDGTTLWVAEVEADFQPGLAGDLVVVSNSQGEIRALDRGTGQRVWTGDVPAPGAPPAVSEDLVVVISEETAHALDTTDGSVRWTRDLDPALGLGETILTQPAVSPSIVVAAGDGGTLVAVSAADGSPVWRTSGARVDLPPLVLGDSVVVLDEDATLTVRSAADGRETASRSAAPYGGELPLSLGYVGGSLLVGVAGSFPFPDTVFAFPTAAAPDVGEPPGLVLHGETRASRAVPVTPPFRLGDDLVFVGAAYRYQVVRLPPDGAAVSLASADSIPFAIPLGDLVLTRLGSRLVALDPQDGGTVWEVDQPAQVSVPGPDSGRGPGVPAVSPGGDRVFAPTEDGGIMALDAGTGQAEWDARGPGPPGFGAPVPVPGAPLALPDGDVITTVPQGLTADPTRGLPLARLDGDTGARRWRIPRLSVRTAMASDGKVVAVPTERTSADFTETTGTLVGLDARTGRVLWRVEGAAFHAPAIADGLVVAADQDGLVTVLDARSGEERWSYRSDTSIPGPPQVLGDVVAFAEGGHSEPGANVDVIRFLDLATGRPLTSFRSESFGVGHAAAAVGDALVLPSARTGLFLLRPEDR